MRKLTTDWPRGDNIAFVRAKASEMTRHLMCVSIDAAFLGLWAVPNFYIGRFIESLHLAGIDEIVLRGMQVLFGVSTLAPICIWIYKDVRVMIKRANRDIQAVVAVETEAGK